MFGRGGQEKGGGMGIDLGIDALIGAADEGVAFFDIGVDAAVTAGPIGMFTE